MYYIHILYKGVQISLLVVACKWCQTSLQKTGSCSPQGKEIQKYAIEIWILNIWTCNSTL